MKVGNKRLFHQVGCPTGSFGKPLGAMVCDIHTTSTPQDKKTVNEFLIKANATWQAKLATVTEATKDFDEVSTKVFGGVPCNVRYTYRANVA